MPFELVKYAAPDFSGEMFVNAPDAAMAPAPRDRVAPRNYHATTIFPEYFKVDGCWPGRAGWTAWPCTRTERLQCGSSAT